MRNSQEYSIAIHALLMIDGLDEKVTSEDISQSSGCNSTNVRKIFAKLRSAGLIDTKSGKGKTALARPAEEITMWDVCQAVEESHVTELFPIHQVTSEQCIIGSHIGEILKPHYDRTLDAMRKELSSVTIADLEKEVRKYQSERCHQ